MAEAAKTPRTKKAKATEPVIVSIKGFDKNLSCRGYQFEVGKTFEHEGTVKACNNGFHACNTDAHPLSVFDYYPPAGSRFCVVTQDGETNTDDGIKIASAKITIDFEITIGDLVKRAWDYVWSKAIKSDDAHVTIEQGAASATGWRGAASATGWRGAASATGERGAASATGEQGAASATGWQGAASATGWRGAASATGWQGAAMASGYAGKVMGALGNALFAVERDDNYEIVSVAAAIVGQDGVEPNIWYVARGGKLVQA
jgi:hypothetical protein